jgi:unsaturated chondroitin disaccharide hydrolase
MVGFAEQLETLPSFSDEELAPLGGRSGIEAIYLKAAKATCDFYIANTASDGIPYWDTGAPLIHKLGDYTSRTSDPYNEFEPIDSSAAAIGAQGLLRLGKYLNDKGQADQGNRLLASRFNGRGFTFCRTVSINRSNASGLDPAFHLSPSKRLG